MKVGVIGGGQLGQMLAMAAVPLDIEVLCLEKSRDCPASRVTDIFVSDYYDRDKIEAFRHQVDVVTYEFENVPIETVRYLSTKLPVYPPVEALEVSQERIQEKNFFNQQGVPTASYASVKKESELLDATLQIGMPGILKTCRLGYDGKGQFHIKSQQDIAKAWEALGNQPLIYEQKIAYDREVSLIVVRGKDGAIAFYPLTENQHINGILATSKAPYENELLTQQAQRYLQTIMHALNYVGVLVVEFFVKENQLLANEMAPRVHNSGHWTIEGAVCSQFENHIRAICGLPLGSTATVGRSVMTNIIGELPDVEAVLKKPSAHLHLYGKKPRPGRKLGHITDIEFVY